jgi:hypothetical protein
LTFSIFIVSNVKVIYIYVEIGQYVFLKFRIQIGYLFCIPPCNKYEVKICKEHARSICVRYNRSEDVTHMHRADILK